MLTQTLEWARRVGAEQRATVGFAEHMAMLDALTVDKWLTPDWQAAFTDVMRGDFIPDDIWTDEPDGLAPLSRAERPDEWLAAAYAPDDFVIIQADDGKTPPGRRGERITSTASAPAVVALMLDRLDVKPDSRVLEIGTGSGYNAALLSVQVGPDRVTTIDVDEDLVALARARLDRLGLHATTTVYGDGTQPANVKDHRMFDRIMSTAAVQRIPSAWVEQCAPGGLILSPWGTAFDNGALVALRVMDDARPVATGFFIDPVSFMWVRDQRVPSRWVPQYIHNTDKADRSATELHPFEPIERAAFAIGLRLPGVIQRVVPNEETGAAQVYVIDPETRSWAAVLVPDEAADALPVMQFGPRRMWDEVERAHAWWVELGKPEHTRFGLGVDGDSQWVWLDTPSNMIVGDDV